MHVIDLLAKTCSEDNHDLDGLNVAKREGQEKNSREGSEMGGLDYCNAQGTPDASIEEPIISYYNNSPSNPCSSPLVSSPISLPSCK